jgi:diguanylate cyclase (GGDEF)-like protein/PAS domain S-box-containing protein
MTSIEKEQSVVLVVDDSAQMRLLARVSLEQAGFSVVEAVDGHTAVKIFKKSKPDIVLLDVVMPGIDGYQTCKALRRLPSGKHVPVLLVTGLDDIKSIEQAYEAGATDFVTKPINWTILQQRVRYMLRASKTFDELQRSKARNEALLNAIPDAMFRLSREGVFLEVKGTAQSTPKLTPAQIIGKSVLEVLPDNAGHDVLKFIGKALRGDGIQLFEYKFGQGDDAHFYEMRITPSGLTEVLAIIRNITERKEAEQQIRFLAYFDSLTKLPNRSRLHEQLEDVLSHAKVNRRLAATLFLGLDQFKRINDTLGYLVGDMLLNEVAQRVNDCVRSSDFIARVPDGESDGDVARLGGDEFSILLCDIKDVQDASHTAKRILTALSQPFMLEQQEVYITASIGIAVAPFDGDEVRTLLKHADTAMHYAKSRGGNNYQFYSQSMSVAAVRQLTLENKLRKAIERDELLLHYQPQLDLQTGELIGMEALVRWQNPEMGLVSPADFIPVAEQTGLIVPIGEWVLHTACVQCKAMHNAGFPPFRVSVNLSSRQFREQGLCKNIEEALRATGLEPNFLELELTESLVMHDVKETIETLRALKEMGIRLAVDDFGTGYSSLSYLKRFPLDILKIDRSFVKDITTDPDSAAIAKAIIAMARSLNLSVTAEGVEEEAQLDFLRRQGCHAMQGFFLSKPLPAPELETFMGDKKSCIA